MSHANARTPVAGERSDAGRWLEPTFVACIAVGYLTPMLVSSFVRVKRFEPITAGPPRETLVESASTTAGNVVILLACLVVLWRCRAAWRETLGPATLLVIAWGVAVLGLLAHGTVLTRGAFLFPLIVVAGTVLRPGRRALAALGWVTLALAAISILMGLVTPDAGRYVRPVELADEKPLSALGILAGPYPSGNNLGVALAIGLPSVVLVRRRWIAAAGTVVTGAAILWTASRTALLAAGLAVLVGLAMRLSERWRDPIAALVLVGAATLAVALPFATRSQTAFTNRGTYWIAGVDAWRADPWVGSGADYYWRVAQSSGALGGFAYHAHNQAIQLLVTGGIVLFALVAAVVVWAVVRAVRSAGHDIAPTMMLTALLVTMVFEVPLGLVDREMYHPFALVTLLIVLSVGRRSAGTAAADADAAAPTVAGRHS